MEIIDIAIVHMFKGRITATYRFSISYPLRIILRSQFYSDCSRHSIKSRMLILVSIKINRHLLSFFWIAVCICIPSGNLFLFIFPDLIIYQSFYNRFALQGISKAVTIR